MSDPTWRLRYALSFDKQADKLDKAVLQRVHTYLKATVASGDPRSRGHGLTGPLAGYWRYRIGDYRVIADIGDDSLVVIAVSIGHRSAVYDGEP